MEINEDDASSSTSSSSSSNIETPETHAPPLMNLPKRKAGRKKFRETRHPVYRGVRLRNKSKWVCEVREPNKKTRIWLGTFPTPEMAARAHDVATLALRGDKSPLNFADSARLLRRAKSTSARDIQKAALEAAFVFRPKASGGGDDNDNKASSSSFAFQGVESGRGDEKAAVKAAETTFVDEEALFNIPGFYNSMAEGLVITPPGMKKGFDWNDGFDFEDMDLTLWRD